MSSGSAMHCINRKGHDLKCYAIGLAETQLPNQAPHSSLPCPSPPPSHTRLPLSCLVPPPFPPPHSRSVMSTLVTLMPALGTT